MNMLLAQVTVRTSSSGDIGSVAPILMIFDLALTVAMIVAVWKLFVKAGQPGWASLIPFYNAITMFRITGRSGWLVLALIVPFWNIYVGLRLVFELARVFGRGVGFGFGLLFLAPIFVMILAFGKSEYVGRNGSRPVPVPTGGLAHAPAAP